MTRIELPYPGDHAELASYLKAVKPFIQEWKYLHRDALFKSPAQAWKEFYEGKG